MNVEIAKIRRLKDDNESNSSPKRIDDEKMTEIQRELNENLTKLYDMQKNDNLNVEEFAKGFIKNIYIVLNTFEEMGVYPDYFYDVIMKMNIEYKKAVDDSNRLRGNYRLFDKTGLSLKVNKMIEKGLNNGYYRIQAYPRKDISDAFLELSAFFEGFNIPHNITNKSDINKIFGDIQNNVTNIMYRFYASDDIIDDVEYLSRLLFEYLCFYVAVGINPKEYLDEQINAINNTKRK